MANDGSSGGLDPGLQSRVDSARGSNAGAGSANQLTEQAIQSMILGSVRSSLTSQPLVGPMPWWVKSNPGFLAAVQNNAADPYLGADPNDKAAWRVYMGGAHQGAAHLVGSHTDKTRPHVTHGPGGDNTLTYAQALNQPLNWSADQTADAIKKFNAAGMPVTNFNDLMAAWGSIVAKAAGMYSMSSGTKKVTPWDALDIFKDEQVKAGTFKDPYAPGGALYTGNIARVERSVADIGEGEAWSALQSKLSDMLGRDPTDQETRDFTYRMHSLAAHNPSISKTIDHYVNGQNTGSTTHTTTSGFSDGDIQEQAYQRAQSDPEYAEFQAGSTYFNAALSALGAIGG